LVKTPFTRLAHFIDRIEFFYYPIWKEGLIMDNRQYVVTLVGPDKSTIVRELLATYTCIRILGTLDDDVSTDLLVEMSTETAEQIVREYPRLIVQESVGNRKCAMLSR
jgi:hypothetical protein